MTENEAIKRVEEFGLHHAIGDLPYSTLTVKAFEMAIVALKEIQQYRAIGTVEECREARERQNAFCEPEYLGENIGIGCRDGQCSCGNIVRSYQNYCDSCGIKLEWGNVWKQAKRENE